MLYEKDQAFRLWFNKVLKHMPGLTHKNLLIESSKEIATGLIGNKSELWTIKQMLNSIAEVSVFQWCAGCDPWEYFMMCLGALRMKAAICQLYWIEEFTSLDNISAGPQPPRSL